MLLTRLPISLLEAFSCTQLCVIIFRAEETASKFLDVQCGFIVDRYKHRPIVIRLLLLASVLTLCCFAWLALPPSWTHGPGPAIAAFGIGHGFSPCECHLALPSERITDFGQVLLVLLVPKIVPQKFISTALGAHKSVCYIRIRPTKSTECRIS